MQKFIYKTIYDFNNLQVVISCILSGQLSFTHLANQGIIGYTKMGTFDKELKFARFTESEIISMARLLRELK